MGLVTWGLIAGVAGLVIFKDRIFTMHFDGKMTLKDEVRKMLPDIIASQIPYDLSMDAIVKKFS